MLSPNGFASALIFLTTYLLSLDLQLSRRLFNEREREEIRRGLNWSIACFTAVVSSSSSSSSYWSIPINTGIIKNLPQLFAAQDFNVATALLDLSTGGPVRLQVLVIKADLDEEDRTIVSTLSVVSWLTSAYDSKTTNKWHINLVSVFNRQISPHSLCPGSLPGCLLSGRTSPWSCGKASDHRLRIPLPATESFSQSWAAIQSHRLWLHSIWELNQWLVRGHDV